MPKRSRDPSQTFPRTSRLAAWPAWRTALLRLAPLAVAATLLALGYLLRAPGARHPNDYHAFAFRTMSYSDIIWLYLRDHVAAHSRPYLDYPLEYPPLTGGLSYLLGYAPSLPAYFALAYAVLALGGLATVAALGGIAGANRWYLAAAPGLLLYGGLNWDLAAIALTALALLAYARGRDAWGTLALVAAIWLKLFPIVFLAAILVERFRDRRWRSLCTSGGLAIVLSAAINLPLARANRANWAYFFTFNNERRAEPSIWTVVPRLAVEQINAASLGLVAVGGLALALLALRARGPVAAPFGATLLLWWLFVNKIYSPQYGMWVYLALALLGVAGLGWRSFAVFDVAYYFASFQILYTSLFDLAPLIEWQTRYLVSPLVVVRLLLLGAFVVGGTVALWRRGGALTLPPRLAGWRSARASGPPAAAARGARPAPATLRATDTTTPTVRR